MATVSTKGVELSVYDLKDECFDTTIRDLALKHFKDKVKDLVEVNKRVTLVLVLKSGDFLETKDWCCNQIREGKPTNGDKSEG